MVKPQLYTVIYCRAFGPRRLWSAPKCQINYYLNEKKNSICGFHDNRKHFMIEKKKRSNLRRFEPQLHFSAQLFYFSLVLLRYADWNMKLLMIASFLRCVIVIAEEGKSIWRYNTLHQLDLGDNDVLHLCVRWVSSVSKSSMEQCGFFMIHYALMSPRQWRQREPFELHTLHTNSSENRPKLRASSHAALCSWTGKAGEPWSRGAATRCQCYIRISAGWPAGRPRFIKQSSKSAFSRIPV